MAAVLFAAILWPGDPQSAFPGVSIARANRLDIQLTVPIRPGDTILIGDSIFELGAGILPYRNHGIAGDTIQGLLARIRPVLDSPAGRVIVEIGINDLQRGNEPDPVPLMRALCASGKRAVWLHALPPNPALYRQEILSRSDVTMPTRAAVEAYNARLAAIACPQVEGRPLDALLQDGVLAERFTIDGLHLSGRGLVELAAHLGERHRAPGSAPAAGARVGR